MGQLRRTNCQPGLCTGRPASARCAADTAVAPCAEADVAWPPRARARARACDRPIRIEKYPFARRAPARFACFGETVPPERLRAAGGRERKRIPKIAVAEGKGARGARVLRACALRGGRGGGRGCVVPHSARERAHGRWIDRITERSPQRQQQPPPVHLDRRHVGACEPPLPPSHRPPPRSRHAPPLPERPPRAPFPLPPPSATARLHPVPAPA